MAESAVHSGGKERHRFGQERNPAGLHFSGKIFGSIVFFFWTESVSDCFSMQTTLLTCQQGAGGGGADLLETGLLEIRPPGQLLLLQDLVLDLRLLVQLDKRGRVR